ncbi:hypothetical protein PC123_g23681 [Phytophthora cactorum]|nr:hypothetical protein PC123_g23681 [Phytophthora cactorum]
MSSLTKTPAQESASADSATSVPASVGTTTTESRLSVDEYHALQYKKRVEDKAAAPEAILEGSSVFHTDAADSESAAVAHKPVTGSHRPREDDPSASSSKR